MTFSAWLLINLGYIKISSEKFGNPWYQNQGIEQLGLEVRMLTTVRCLSQPSYIVHRVDVFNYIFQFLD